MDAVVEQVPERVAARCTVTLSLSSELVERVCALTPNLSKTVERLLERYVRDEGARGPEADAKLQQVLTALNEVHERSGFLSDEFHTP